MKIMLIIIAVTIFLVCYMFFSATTRRIRKIQSLINKDRTVCDYIETLSGCNVCSEKLSKEGLAILVKPIAMPLYKLKITYYEKTPTNEQIDNLYKSLTSGSSIVTKAHSANMPVGKYIEKLANQHL